MNIILKIAKAELKNLFYSPIAWLVIITFYVAIAALFTLGYDGLTRLQDVTLEVQKGWDGFSTGITHIIFAYQCTTVLQLLYLFMPLLTMGIINREINSGTIKLLYSSPISSKDIVLGKFLGLVVLTIVLLIALFLFMVIGYFTVENPEFKWNLSMLLGLFLLLNTYAAIGIFISALTRYQIVAAVLTFTVFFVLSAIGGLWQQYDLFRDISFYLSIAGKAENMLAGLITSRDVSYFLIIIFMFLGFTVIKLNSTQSTISKPVLFTRYLSLFLVVVVFVFFTSKSGNILYADVTSNKNNTITPQVQEVIKQLDGSPLRVTLYNNLLGRGVTAGLPKARNEYLWGFWEKYRRFYPNMELEYVHYYDIREGDSSLYHFYPDKTIAEIAEIHIEMYDFRTAGLRTPEEVREMIDLSKEDYGLVMQLEYNGKKELLRTYGNLNWPSESNVAATIKRLTRNDEAKVVYLSGHFERNPFSHYFRDFSQHLTLKDNTEAAINHGFDTDTISINTNQVPSNTALLVIADPKLPYTPTELEKISNYLHNGGNAMILGEPGKEDLLNPILNQLGLHLERGLIVSPNEHEMPHILNTQLTNEGTNLSDDFFAWTFRKTGQLVGGTKMVGATNIEIVDSTNYKVKAIYIKPDIKNTWIEKSKVVVDSAAPIFSSPEGDVIKSKYTVVASLTRQLNGKEQRIIVAGDADFMSNERFSGNNHGLSFYSWLLYNQYPVYAHKPNDLDRKFTIDNSFAKIIQYVFLYLMPLVLFISSIILLIRRKRK